MASNNGSWKGSHHGKPNNLRGEGHGSILGTCDAGREKECSKELLNAFNQVIEWMDETGTENDSTIAVTAKSICNSLEEEIAQLKANNKNSSKQKLMSVDVGIKGLVLIQMKTSSLCPVKLVKFLFDRIRNEKTAYTKHVVRLIPLQYIGFPNANELELLCKNMIADVFPGYGSDAAVPVSDVSGVDTATPSDIPPVNGEAVSKDETSSTTAAAALIVNKDDATTSDVTEPANKRQRVEPLTTPPTLPSICMNRTLPIPYSILFKSRSSNSIVKSEVHNCIFSVMPKGLTRSNYKTPEDVIIVEAVKNLLGISYFSDYTRYGDFNIRKFQMQIRGELIEPVPAIAAVAAINNSEGTLDEVETNDNDK